MREREREERREKREREREMRSYIHRDKNIDINRYRYIIHIDDVGTKLSSIVSCGDTTLMPCSIMILTLSCSGVIFCFYSSNLSFSLSLSLSLYL